MPSRPRFRGLPVLLLSLLLAAGCSGVAQQLPEPAPDRESADRAAALGDPRTVDPCSLVDDAALARFGEVRDAGTVSLDYCLLRVRADGGALAQVKVGELAPEDPGQSDPVVGEAEPRIAQEAPLPGHCTRRVLLGDRSVLVSADQLAGGPGVELCGMAQAGAEQVAAAIREHRVSHRNFPANSLAVLDPCRVLSTDVVRQVPGLENAEPVAAPGGHQCQWGPDDASAPRVRLVHTAGDPPAVLHGTAVEEQIAGRRTVTSVVGGDPATPLCSAETGHLPFGPAGDGQVEVAMLVVAYPDGTGLDACEFARGLAERAWPGLPPR
ncbi:MULTISPECIES: DUF3558 family protein [unclassified Saccharopolyspora]|uniref:DUF3558 family protein n=1 Tax=unclassified Saccharopolyspora TaxID=2646250 RepID=UPI001CD7F9BE|nr:MULTISPECIES: DUF3558 family protein [unclassified Saccharopolyspora]MCA1186808.1 DUF3558 domain-containing protein [Saccharopolyspora sp. 6T]MCA1190897.1 DUF3558 domain-containing protein [Saccharopolyspora sp. 6V]MCA1225551.1 DUF3558 domain-containing protein [Saccharopolyspora sp. 6M]MCA1278777.1 DUF3558 domain-containing protein [Saccharopolyspora sp. 7B]